MSRFYTQIKEDFNKFKLGMTFLLTTRGIPQIYYGTEILITNPKSDAHGEIRADMPGGWQGDTKNVFKHIAMTERETEALNFMTQLLQWRKNTPVIHSGKLKHFTPENGVYVQFRYNDKQKVMVILNKNTEAKSLDLARFKEILKPNFRAKDVFHQKTISVKDGLNLEPNSPLILEIFE